MSNGATLNLPARVTVSRVLSSRYSDNLRPESWDDRREGSDEVVTSDQQQLKLWSDGGQSPPKPGWIILLTDGSATSGFKWTLYSIPPRTPMKAVQA